MANEIVLTGAQDTGSPVAGMRTMEEITAEAIRHQMEGADAVIGLGKCLMEAKELLAHGEWLSWLSENLNLSERSAQRLMMIARNCSNPTALSDLGKTKVLAILTLPPAEQTLFLNGDYVPEGADKSVSDMTTRELQQVIKERDDTQEQLEYTQSKLASANKQIGKLSGQLVKAQRSEEKALAKASRAEESRLKMEEDMRLANAELEELRNRPTDVAIQYERDEAAIEEARQEVRAEMQGKLDEANAAQRKADEERKAAEDALESARASAEAELQEVNAQLDAARKAAKKAIVDGDKDLAVFNAYFVQAQELAGKMRNAFLAIREKDPATAEKMTNAVKALQGVIGGITA